MKGLLIKDICLLLKQKKFFITLVLMAIGLVFITQDASFIIGYLTYIISSFVMSTISYDEFDNGNVFLFSLPISRNTYVLEKYLFALTIGGIVWIITTIIASIYQSINTFNFIFIDWLLSVFTVYEVLLFILSLMIPIQLKFGSDKGRMAILGAFVIVGGLGFLIVNSAEMLNIDINLFLNSLSTLNIGTVVLVILILSLICLFISYMISVKIMNKKEF